MATTSAYGASAREIRELFGDYLDGGATRAADAAADAAAGVDETPRPALALSAAPLPDVARSALEKSLAAFGFGDDACLFATLAPHNPAAEGGDIRLDAQALFLLVEGIDPLYVIATDEESAAALAAAYRTEFPLDAPIRAFGRPAAAFANLSALLQTDAGKQKAWQVLKSLVA